MTDLSHSPIEVAHPTRSLLGEGACYDPQCKTLFWLDIKGGYLFSLDLAKGETQEISLNGMVSAIAPAQNHQFICCYKNGFAFLDVIDNKTHLTHIIDPEADILTNRFNDGKVDFCGNFWAGTMDNNEKIRSGSWWRLQSNGSVDQLADNCMVTNGPAFAPESQRGFLVDSADRTIFEILHSCKGITSQNVFRVFQTKDGYPDGITLDREGFLWVAFWDGGCIRRLAQDGTINLEIETGAQRPTSIEIIGNRIFITTATIGLTSNSLHLFDGKLLTTSLSRPVGFETRSRFNDLSFR